MIRRHTISFQNALRGLFWALKTQPNFRIHASLSILAVSLGWWLKINYAEFLTVLTLIVMGFAVETVNTAIEETTDAIDTKRRPDIGLAKDISAGAMLVVAVGSVCIGAVIYIPKLLTVFGI